MKVALYARVSMDDLHCENQKLVLDAWATRNPEEKCTYFQEDMTSRKGRPVKESVLNAFREGKFDTIVIVAIGRWARSIVELVTNVEEVINSSGRFVIVHDNMDFTKKQYNAAAALSLHIFAAFAQFEREMIRERTIDGLARARSIGKALGRHPVNCGCGFKSEDGKVSHNGDVKPIRDKHNTMIAWKYPDGRTVPIRRKQTPLLNTPPQSIGK